MNFNHGYMAYWGAGLAERYAESIGRWASEQAGIPYVPALTSWGAHMVSNAMLKKYAQLINGLNKIPIPEVKLPPNSLKYGSPKEIKDVTNEFFKGVADKLNFGDSKWVLHGVFQDDFYISNRYFVRVYRNANDKKNTISRTQYMNDAGNFGRVSVGNTDVLLSFLANSITMPSVKSSNTKFTRFDQDMYLPNNTTYDGSLTISYFSDVRNKFDLLIREIIDANKFRNNSNYDSRGRFDISVTTYTYRDFSTNSETTSNGVLESQTQTKPGERQKQILFCNETVFKDIVLDNVANYTLAPATEFLTKTVAFNFNDVYDITYSERIGGANLEKLVYYMYKGFSHIVENTLPVNDTSMNNLK